MSSQIPPMTEATVCEFDRVNILINHARRMQSKLALERL